MNSLCNHTPDRLARSLVPDEFDLPDGVMLDQLAAYLLVGSLLLWLGAVGWWWLAMTPETRRSPCDRMPL